MIKEAKSVIRSQEPKNNRQLVREYICQSVLYQDAVARKLELTPSDMKCFVIMACYGPMTAGDLARRTGYTTGGITRILDHLEKRGFVRRRPSDNDRRAIIIELLATDENRMVEHTAVGFDQVIAQLVSEFSPEDMRVIADFLQKGTALFHTMTTQLQELNTKETVPQAVEVKH